MWLVQWEMGNLVSQYMQSVQKQSKVYKTQFHQQKKVSPSFIVRAKAGSEMALPFLFT